jgi:O-antigen/teichoic acid export membrane protein
MTTNKATHQQILKLTAFLGGIQFFLILISIIRSKIISVLLGTLGIGIMSLLTTSTSFISAITSFGLSTSAVKNISVESISTDKRRLVVIVKVIRKLALFTGLLGLLITISLSNLLSYFNFHNSNFTFSFILISISILFAQLTIAENVILQGLNEYKLLSNSNLYSSLISLIATSPIYYFGGIKFIPLGLLLTSIISFIIAKIQTMKISTIKIQINTKINYFTEGKDILVLGFFIGLNGIITLGISYFLRAFISNFGGIEMVGLYSAGFAIVNTYVGMIFTAMGTDYYPRLAKLTNDNSDTNECINKQIEVAFLLLFPIIIFFLVFSKIIINILYSDKFLSSVDMVQFATLGILFKAASWAIAFVFLAKNNKKIYFWNELIADTYMLGLNLIFFYYFKLSGLGFSFFIGYLLYFIQVYYFANKFYNFKISNKSSRNYFIIILLSTLTLIIMKCLPSPYNMFIATFIFLYSLYFSYNFYNNLKI